MINCSQVVQCLRTETKSPLAAIADNGAFVLVAYFFAFFPWGFMANFDFISEKWRTIRRTRKLGNMHIACSVIPVFYVAVYAEAQRQDRDWKEYGAALAALSFNVVNFVRTMIGVTQAQLYVSWCLDAVKCMNAIRGVSVGNANDEERIRTNLRVNNSIVDNELGGTDSGVRVSWKKMWECLKRRDFQSSTWWETELVRLCTVRWAGAFLCSMGNDWSGDLSMKGLEKFFNADCKIVLKVLSKVTWTVSREGNEDEVISTDQLSTKTDSENKSDVIGSAAYGMKLVNYKPCHTFKSYELEFEGLRSSFPSNNKIDEGDNRDRITMEMVDNVVIAKAIGHEKLANVKQYNEKYVILNYDAHFERRHSALELFYEQCDITDNTCLYDFTFGRVPCFPYEMQMVALWDDCTNWRVLQASVHADNMYSIGHLEGVCCGVFCGVVIETVRSFLAKWVGSKQNDFVPEWSPDTPSEAFKFRASSYLSRNSFKDEERLLWECQNALQKEVAKTANTHPDLPSSAACIMLFLLGWPGISFRYQTKRSNASGSNANLTGNASNTREVTNTVVDLSTIVLRAYCYSWPDTVDVKIECNAETGNVSLVLIEKSSEHKFIWQKWIDSVMMEMKRMDDTRNETHENVAESYRHVRCADLRCGMIEFCPFDHDHRRVVKFWAGWPPFDLQICQYEIEQWLDGVTRNSFKYYDRLKDAMEVLSKLINEIEISEEE